MEIVNFSTVISSSHPAPDPYNTYPQTLEFRYVPETKKKIHNKLILYINKNEKPTRRKARVDRVGHGYGMVAAGARDTCSLSVLLDIFYSPRETRHVVNNPPSPVIGFAPPE